MKNLKNYFTLFILVLITSCSKDNDTTETPDGLIVNLAITNISPTTGPKNTPVTITGTGFSTTPANNAVTINGKVCSVVNSTATQLTITIPPSAGSGKIKVVIAGANAESGNFESIVTTTVTTIAGNGSGFQDGQGTNAQFNAPRGITIDTTGNLYVGDFFNHKIRKITPNGQVTTIAGSTKGFADGIGSLAKFDFPEDVAIDAAGNLYITDVFNNKIRKISSTGQVSTIAGSTEGFTDGQGVNAKFSAPVGITIDNAGNLYITDHVNHKIRKITPNGLVTTIAGSTSGFADGIGNVAKFDFQDGIEIDATGNLFISDLLNNKIRKVSSTGQVSTITGSTQGLADGQGVNAKFYGLRSSTIDAAGNLYVVESRNNKVRKISPTGLVTTVAGSSSGFIDGNGASAQFNGPHGITIDSQGNLYVVDTGNHKIRKITFD